ncbi:MAG: GMC family oxidoreductase [Thermomicrobiales bacterium]
MPVSSRRGDPAEIPSYADTVILGGGTSGCVIAGLLAEQSDESILVLEAGPDFGPLADGRWPADLVDASALGNSHDWGYSSEDCYPNRVVNFERARVIGGCSAHNGCAAVWGSRRDYDAWAAAGNDGWSTNDLLPLFETATQRLRVRTYDLDELTPFQRACLEAGPGAGLPIVENLNDLDEEIGISPSPVNIAGGVRWNTAFAYLDPVRHKPSLTICGGAMADRLTIENGRVTAVHVVDVNGLRRVNADRVVLAGGAYGSPAMLLRSGIGDPEDLRAAGITPVHALPGVGRNLHDHPSAMITYAGTSTLEQQMTEFGRNQWMPEETVIAKARSSVCEDGFDIHFYPVGGPDMTSPSGWKWELKVACMTPISRGSVRLTSNDPFARPVIDHRYLSDPCGLDRDVLVDAVALARELANQPGLSDPLGEELSPGPSVATNEAIRAFVDISCVHYYHPVGTCKMGPASDSAAVIDARGAVHGLEGVFVADCSIMPVIPRANTNVPAVVVGEKIARLLLNA